MSALLFGLMAGLFTTALTVKHGLLVASIMATPSVAVAMLAALLLQIPMTWSVFALWMLLTLLVGVWNYRYILRPVRL